MNSSRLLELVPELGSLLPEGAVFQVLKHI